MKRSIALFVSAMLCATFVFAKSGDSLTIIATVPEKTPSLSIVRNVVEGDLSVSVFQEEDARYRGTVFLEVPVSGWVLEDAALSEGVLCRTIGDAFLIEAMYDGYRPKGVLATMDLRKRTSADADAPELVFASP